MPKMMFLALCLALSAYSVTCQQIGGATSVGNMLTQLINDYNSDNADKLPAYASVGSGAGIKGFLSGSYALGVSDNPLSSQEVALARAAKIVPGTFPFTLSTYSVVVKGAGLSLTGCQLASIYTGAITRWERIKGSGRTGTIVPLLRDSSSGTTEVFTTYIKKSCNSWPTRFVGVGPFATGNPNLKLVKGSDGMGSAVQSDANAIGYLQTNYGIIKYGNTEVSIENRAKAFVTAANTDPYQSVPRSLPTSYQSWSGVNLVFQPGVKTFPIVSFVYMLGRNAYTKDGKIIKSFLNYVMTPKGQAIASTHYFSPLPSQVLSINLVGISAIKG